MVTQGPAAGPGRPAQPRRGWSRRRRRIVVIGVGIVATGLWWAGWNSPLTQVEHVVVEAPRGISEAAVRLASGIAATDHVPAVDAQGVRTAVMTAIPAVADVEVTRSLPHTVRLVVSARQPLAALESGKGFYVMDAEGVAFDKVGSAKGLPVIKARTQVGRDAARGVLLSLPPKLRKKVVRITARTRDDVTLEMKDSSTVRWGSVEDAELKARVLTGLLKVRATDYDVSAPLLPTTSGRLPDPEDAG